MEDHNMKKKYFKPEIDVLDEECCELLVTSKTGVTSNLTGDETIEVGEEPVEDGFWGR